MVSNITTQKMKKTRIEYISQTTANLFHCGGMQLPVLVFCQEDRTDSAGFMANNYSLEVSSQSVALRHSPSAGDSSSGFVQMNF